MRLMSVAKKNNIILILSLTPFIIGLIFSIYQSSDTSYLSVAINISGSQRMRTMLLSNYAQQYYQAYALGDEEERDQVETILQEEILLYRTYYMGMMNGDGSIELKPNPFMEITQELNNIRPLVNEYIESINGLLEDPSDRAALNYVTSHAMMIKNQFHLITNHYQEENDRIIARSKALDSTMLVLASLVTLLGLLLTTVIRTHEFQAKFDQLTGLKNRHSFYEFVKSEKIGMYSLIFVDVDDFKKINDEYGHDVGDEILEAIANRLSLIIPDGHLFRYGGDEFIGLIDQDKVFGFSKDIDRNFESLLFAIESAFDRGIVDSKGGEHRVGLSIGVVSKRVQMDAWEEIIALADRLMYHSKKIGKTLTLCRNPEDVKIWLKES